MKKHLILCSLVAATVGSVHADMSFETIGDPGNIGDAGAGGRGAVGYTYQIGTFEVTGDEYAASGLTFSDGAKPAVNMTWHDAARFCNWMTTGNLDVGAYQVNGSGVVTGMLSRAEILADGGQFYLLPTADEWHKAAYFKNGAYSIYANGTGTAPATNVANQVGSGLGQSWVGGTGLLAEQNGTFDMNGNVYEWTESELGNASKRIILGGYYDSGTQSMKSNTSIIDQAIGDGANALGFRVVAVPEPGTMSLMGLSTLGIFLARGHKRRKFMQSIVPVKYEKFCDAYVSREEWKAARDLQNIEEPVFQGVVQPVKAKTVSAIHLFKVNCKNLDRVILDYFAKKHERNVIRYKAFRVNFKENSLKRLDRFLELIMK